jgi:hypothetical protein
MESVWQQQHQQQQQQQQQNVPLQRGHNMTGLYVRQQRMGVGSRRPFQWMLHSNHRMLLLLLL